MIAFLFPHFFCLLVNKLDSNYLPSIFNVLALVKPYFPMTFVNVGNGITGIEPVLINFTMSDGWLKFSSTWVIIDYLKWMNWSFYLFSFGDSNNFNHSSAPVKLLIWCWIDCQFLLLLFWFFLLVWRWLSPFIWLVSLPPWYCLTH